MVHIFVAVSTNRLVTPSAQHATASYIVLCCYYYHYYDYMSCICIYYVYRPSRSKPTRPSQNLYIQPATSGTETKTTASNYPTPLYPRRHRSQSSIRLDDSSIMSNHMMHRNRILPEASASNRLKTLRSLLFRGHKTLGIDPIAAANRYHHHRDPDSTISEYHIRSSSQSVDESHAQKSSYEEQEDCVELKSERSTMPTQKKGVSNKTKSNQEPRQITSWDDI